MNEKINLLLKANQRSVQFCEPEVNGVFYQESAKGITDSSAEVNYVNGQGFVQNREFNPNYRNHPNLSYRSTNVENPQDQVYPQQNQQAPQFPAKPAFQNQGFQKSFSPGFQQKQPFNSFQGKAQAPFQPPPSPADNSQDELKAMMQQLLVNQQKTANDINVKVDSMYNDLNGKFEALSTHVKKLDVQVAQTAEAIKRQEGSLPGKTEVNPKQYVNAITLGNSEEPEFTSERVYVPKIPYPKPFREPSVPLPSVLHQEKPKVPDASERHTPSPLRELPKLASPGQFKVPCLIQGVEFKDSLCDTGANVNVISHSVAKKLGISRLQPSKNFIEFADASSNSPHGFIADLKLQIGDCLVPVDFHVMEMKKDVHTPIILGSSFLTTVGAIVDFPNRRISFSKINKKVFYPIVPDEVPSCMTATTGKKLTSYPRPDKEKLESAPIVKPHLKPLEDVKPAKVKSNRPPKSFSKVSIIIPLELRDKGKSTIREKLQGTINLFPNIVSWDNQGSKLVARGKRRERSVAEFPHDERGEEALSDPSQA